MSNNLFCVVKMLYRIRLHLLVLSLGVQTILSLNINKSLVLADDDDASGTNSDFNVTNQSSTHSLLNAFDANSNVNNRNNSRNDAIQSSGRAAGSSKLYNKVNSRKRKLELDPDLTDWKCPNISENSRFLECGCDMPHALRCSGDIHGLEQLARGLRTTKYSVSLLDCTLKNVTFLSDTRIFENVSLHGLVISSGEIKRVHRLAFLGMKTPLQTLGLPNNALSEVPWNSLSPLNSLDRLDLSNNRIKAIGAPDFLRQTNLTYLELSDNQISNISPKAFLPLKNLLTLKLNGNRLGEMPSSIQTIAHCTNLRELDLATNSIKGPLTRESIPALRFLELLNLDRNSISSIRTGALQNFPSLVTLTLRHNQIDVLQDHAFSGLGTLQTLDLGYNGIVAVSGASLQHLLRLSVLNLTHNFLRALTSDLTAPLPALRELHLDGNDISIVSKTAFDTVEHLTSLSLRDNPLSCDCTLKTFAEWMPQSNLQTHDLMSAVCATPPHLEGAPLYQIPLPSLNCDGNVNKYDNSDVLHQVDVLSKENNFTFVKEFSDAITLKNIHLSADYGLILTWSVNSNNRDFSCDAVFIYHESGLEAILMNNAPIKVNCESSEVNNENIVSVILHDTERLIVGDNYRFCLVLVHQNGSNSSLIVGCSNITKLKTIDSALDAVDDSGDQKKFTDTSLHTNQFSGISEDQGPAGAERMMMNTDVSTVAPNSLVKSPSNIVESDAFDHLNDFAVIGLCIAILCTIVFALFWITPLVKTDRRSSPAIICYAADDHRSADIENSNRYLKLQATTTL